MIDELSGPLAARLPDSAKDSGLGDAAKIALDGRRPASSDHVEIHDLGDPVSMGQCAGLAVVGLENRIERERDAVGEQRLPAVAIERCQCIPEFGRILWQSGDPGLMSGIEGIRQRAILQPRRLCAEPGALDVDLQAGVLSVAVEHLQTEGVQRSGEGDVGLATQRVAKGERPVRRQLGHEPVGNGLQALIFVGLA